MRKLSYLLLCTCLLSPHTWADDEIDLGKNITQYQRFAVHPYLEKGLEAQRKGEREKALDHFRRAREIAPENAAVALYLARAYESYGMYDEAEKLVVAQLKTTPEDTALQTFHLNLQLRKPQDPDCTLLPCRIVRAEQALKAKDLDKLQNELKDNALASSPQGLVLRHNLLAQGIEQQRWPLVNEQFAWLYARNALTPQEQEQWVWSLLQQNKVSDAQALQKRLQLTNPKINLAIGMTLAKQQGKEALAHYQTEHQPEFEDELQEREWLQLMHQAGTLTLGTPLQFKSNHGFREKLLLADLQKQKRWNEVAQVLRNNPELATPELEFEIAIQKKQWSTAEQIARRWIRQSPSVFKQLDLVSYRLLKEEQLILAQDLLVEHWPFTEAPPALKESLTGRLITLLPQTLSTQALPAVLKPPLQTRQEQEMQIQVLAAARDCDSIIKVMENLKAEYSAESWSTLGNCYRQRSPGLAEYAYKQAARHSKQPQTIRALAYQAHANQNYQAAVEAWRQTDMAQATEQERLSAIYSALAAEEMEQAGVWLEQYKAAGMPLEAPYWRSLAKTQEGEAAIASLHRAITLSPLAQDYGDLAGHYTTLRDNKATEAALLKASEMEPDNLEYQRAYGYTLLSNGEKEAAGVQLEKIYRPGDLVLTKDLAYINQATGNNEKARLYAARAADLLPVSQEQFAFRRMHEDLGRRWTISLDSWTGTPGGSQGSSQSSIPGGFITQPGTDYGFQTYAQMEIDYRLGAEPVKNGKMLSAYGRIYAGGESNRPFTTQKPVLGLGLRWKPLSEQILFLAAEHVRYLSDSQNQASDTMLRASASFLNGDEYSDDWHEEVKGWWARNLYLDAARYLHAEQTSLQADYRHSYHHKIARGQTLEPYAHIQGQRFIDDKGDGDFRKTLVGVGLRWNRWFGETEHDAWRHKMTVGLEYQRVLNYSSDSNPDYNKDIFRLTVGVRW